MPSTYICAIKDCGNTLSERSSREICSRCQSVARYWRKHPDGPDAVIVRQSKLRLWQARMIYLGGQDKDYAKAKRVISAALTKRA